MGWGWRQLVAGRMEADSGSNIPGDVGESTGEWILQEVEHGEELARGHKHVVTEPSSNDGVVHDRLVGLVLEVAVPARAEFWVWPRVHLVELLLGWSDLDTGLDTVGGQWTSSVDVPLVEDLFLCLLVSTNEIVERLNPWLGAVCGEGQVVVLEVQTNTGKVDQWLDTSLAELGRLTC